MIPAAIGAAEAIAASPLTAELLQLAEEIGMHVSVPLLRAVKAGDFESGALSLRVAIAAAGARKIVAESAKIQA